METIQNLISVLKDQKRLYEELYQLLMDEKDIIINWDIDRMMELPKIKDTFFYKEKMLEESRKNIEKKLKDELNIEINNIDDILKNLEDHKLREEIISLRDELLALIDKISAENNKVKVLYNTNLKLISDFFSRVGVMDEKSGYSPKGAPVYSRVVNRG
ncbi:flagellar export chaperone FlgN [Deferribacter thermophilus]|uniref:flagellar export chaperone FlgN n=1 Tax=Deferribacter thermophilus TaxID=53573 RepID=UPI003C189927